MASLLKQCSPLLRSIGLVKQHVPSAGIVGKAMRPPDYSRPPPYPYWEKDYSTMHQLFDKTTFRFDTNTALVVVEAPFGAGKRKFAEKLSELLDFHFLPDLPMKDSYIEDGHDTRQLDIYLPDHLKSFLEADFHRDPYNPRSHHYQHRFLALRLKNYCDALMHILNTGQGVVMTRSVFSAYVYVDLMIKLGMLNPAYDEYHELVTKFILPMLWRPHLIIYLDTPYEVCMENIRKRGRDYEQGSPLFTKEGHDFVDMKFKTKYMQRMSHNAHLMSYDNTNEIDVDDVVYDIEQLEWYSFLHKKHKAVDWLRSTEGDYNAMRSLVTTNRWHLTTWLNCKQPFDVPEMHHTVEDSFNHDAAYCRAMKEKKWDPRYDPKKKSFWDIYLNPMYKHKGPITRECFYHEPNP